MEFVQKFTPLDFQVKNFTPSILPNFNSFSKKKTQKMSENGEIYTAGKILRCRRQWEHGLIPPLDIYKIWLVWGSLEKVLLQTCCQVVIQKNHHHLIENLLKVTSMICPQLLSTNLPSVTFCLKTNHSRLQFAVFHRWLIDTNQLQKLLLSFFSLKNPVS